MRPHVAWRQRRSSRAGGGPWFFAAGCGPSGQAAARVCVQWAKEAPGGQVYEVGPKDAIHVAPTIRFRDVRLSRDESLGFHALDKELLRVCRQIDRIDFMVPTASLYSYQPELDISLDEPVVEGIQIPTPNQGKAPEHERDKAGVTKK